ncbi:DUF6600 domain-containing protein [Rosettibacter firmus]|uniref:DUF6600 domain-containing protein n=1 Tax=Rosettibacter firmus TaxID=3111522 RepID=UPI00336C2C21
MNRKIVYLLFLISLITTINAKQPFREHTYKIFYAPLKPYGEWIEIERDVIVWRPIRIQIGWKPYLIGRWCWTKYGWYWDSFEPFGWAVYHYGRWYYDDYYGWIWIPDDEWGPAWVEWRYDDFYIGWAPLPPYAHFRIDIGIHFTINWHSHYHYWNFVRYEHFHNHSIHHYVISSNVIPKIFNRTKYRSDYYYRDGRIINEGIEPRQIEKRINKRIREYEIRDIDSYKTFEIQRRRDENKIVIYRVNEQDYRNLDRIKDFELRRPERKSSLRRDDLIFPEREIKRRGDDSYRREENENIKGNQYNNDIIRNGVERENSRSFDRRGNENDKRNTYEKFKIDNDKSVRRLNPKREYKETERRNDGRKR